MGDERMEEMLDGRAWAEMPEGVRERAERTIGAHAARRRAWPWVGMAAALLVGVLIGWLGAPLTTTQSVERVAEAEEEAARVVVTRPVFTGVRRIAQRPMDHASWREAPAH